MPGPEEGSGVLSEVSLDQATDACFRRWICITTIFHFNVAKLRPDIRPEVEPHENNLEIPFPTQNRTWIPLPLSSLLENSILKAYSSATYSWEKAQYLRFSRGLQ